MKANELMIGDWVSIGENYIRVTSLKEGEEYLEAKPIPITEEILEKNGFIGNGSRFTYKDIQFMFTRRGFVFQTSKELSIASGDGSHINRLPRYVHILQHALRLCGLDMEIVL